MSERCDPTRQTSPSSQPHNARNNGCMQEVLKGDPEEACRHVWSLNIHRRHMTQSQKGACAAGWLLVVFVLDRFPFAVIPTAYALSADVGGGRRTSGWHERSMVSWSRMVQSGIINSVGVCWHCTICWLADVFPLALGRITSHRKRQITNR